MSSRRNASARASASSLQRFAPGALSASVWCTECSVAIGPQHHQIFFLLRIAEITHRPKRRRHLLAINLIRARDPHAAPQIFVDQRIERVLHASPRAGSSTDPRCARAKPDRPAPRPAAHPSKIARSRRPPAASPPTAKQCPAPPQAASASSRPSTHAVIRQTLAPTATAGSAGGAIASASGTARLSSRLRVRKSPARQIKNPADHNRDERAKPHNRARNAAIPILRAHQRKAGQKRVHRVVPGTASPEFPTATSPARPRSR